MSSAVGAQSRYLRRKLLGRLVVSLAVYLVVFAAIAVLLEVLVVDDFANWVADNTSTWVRLSESEQSAFFRSSDYADNLTSWQIIPQDDGSIMVRDLTIYRAMQSAKIPATVMLCLVGYVIIVLVALNRSIRYFDELSSAVTSMVRDREKPVVLSEDLAIVQGELNAIREASRADERAALVAEQRKNELVAYLAHDIKTPLTSVLGYLSLLQESDDLPDSARRKYASIAYEKAERLEGLIDEFFEITRYNLQAIPIERATVDVQLFCEQVAEEFAPMAQSRSVGIAVDAPAGMTFFVDADKLARALGNVLRNAVSFAEEGTTIRLEAHRLAFENSAPGAPEGSWIISVTNQGREISEAHLQSIFEKFYREDGARSTREGGSGLGLAIAKEIVIAHGGGIKAESSNGVTTFTIAVP